MPKEETSSAHESLKILAQAAVSFQQRLYTYTDTKAYVSVSLKKDSICVQRYSLCLSASVANSWQNFPASPAEKIRPLRKKIIKK